MPETNRKLDIRLAGGPRAERTGDAGARACSDRVVFAEYLLAMRMPGHAARADAAADAL